MFCFVLFVSFISPSTVFFWICLQWLSSFKWFCETFTKHWPQSYALKISGGNTKMTWRLQMRGDVCNGEALEWRAVTAAQMLTLFFLMLFSKVRWRTSLQKDRCTHALVPGGMCAYRIVCLRVCMFEFLQSEFPLCACLFESMWVQKNLWMLPCTCDTTPARVLYGLPVLVRTNESLKPWERMVLTTGYFLCEVIQENGVRASPKVWKLSKIKCPFIMPGSHGNIDFALMIILRMPRLLWSL